MRARILLVVTAAAFGAFPGSAHAQLGQDSATGDVITVAFRPIGFSFDAHSGPSGENPSGSARWIDRAETFGGPVTCLNVTGNRATIGFENLEGAVTGIVKGGFLFVEDNRIPGAGPDNARGQFVFSAAPTVCPPNTVVYESGPDGDGVTSGELTVHDAPALPTSKDQCKNGGWRTYGVFKNQGDCVSFVATGGKNPPGKKAG
jgi:hypothetical protein